MRFFVRYYFWFLLTLIALPAVATAESKAQFNLQLYNTIYHGRADSWYYGGNGLAELNFSTQGNPNIKAGIKAELTPYQTDAGTLATEAKLKKLWVKVRFPHLRFTIGQTRLTWGNGFLFNAGDLLFGSFSSGVDFSQAELRSETAFLTALNIPIGQFSFIEAVVLPPDFVYNETTKQYNFQTISKLSAGIRAFFNIKGFRLETGYLYKGDDTVEYDILGHRPYLSFHGHLGVDIYGSASMAVSADKNSWNDVSKTISFSLGAFHTFNVGYSASLALRFEALLMPWRQWQKIDYTQLISGDSYGLLLYPQVSLTFSSAWTIGVQSIISPVDGSAMLNGSLSWQVMQGLTFLFLVNSNIGSQDTLFAWDRTDAWPQISGADLPDYTPNGISFTLGARYIY